MKMLKEQWNGTAEIKRKQNFIYTVDSFHPWSQNYVKQGEKV